MTQNRFSIAQTELADENSGKVGRRIGSGLLAVPQWAGIERGCIHWKGFSFGNSEPSLEILDRFIRLSGADDAEILSFAQVYGTLRRPLRHCQIRSKADFEGRERLSRWRTLSLHASNLLEIAAALRSGDELTFDEWSGLMNEERLMTAKGDHLAFSLRNQERLGRELEALTGNVWEGLDLAPFERRALLVRDRAPQLGLGVRADREKSRLFQANFLNAHSRIKVKFRDIQDGQPKWRYEAGDYLHAEISAWNDELGPVTFGMEPDDNMPAGYRTVFDFGGSLPCYIGFQLMLVVAGGDAFVCSGCHKPYLRPRGRKAAKGFRKAPKDGEQNYCQGKECIRERNRIAQRKRRIGLAEANPYVH